MVGGRFLRYIMVGQGRSRAHGEGLWFPLSKLRTALRMLSGESDRQAMDGRATRRRNVGPDDMEQHPMVGSPSEQTSYLQASRGGHPRIHPGYYAHSASRDIPVGVRK